MRHLHPLSGAAAAAVLVTGLTLAAPLRAAEDQPAPQPAPPLHHHAMAHHGGRSVEAQISRLRQDLHITDAQAEPFNAVAQIMRDNHTAHDQLVAEKLQNAKTSSAVDDLRAYSDIAQAHADGVKRLAGAFETLYAALSDEQKKAADTAFRRRFLHPAGQRPNP